MRRRSGGATSLVSSSSRRRKGKGTRNAEEQQIIHSFVHLLHYFLQKILNCSIRDQHRIK